ncbi:hypothetical protein [Streptomyces sp. DHE17-7]|uniref:hypothetical protein n=1 Tax=Streptomyces sp. DHE17-7 TaxID=2759949 RepID=UPI000EE22913|nr:hypothetical protein [Streptomyces sp. DHE17-7]RIH58140.1 hypothetical protein D3C59_37075 [Streptomyces sp. SHP22-7]MBJ6623532.1 hypothetical protein [Streptomyces sp. DHE17-7]RIH58152.1 hypothetical protein D3C59_36990 [Streptomyces sp. SHP22-7]RIH58413.1 hypothetical protein D3C59_35320 [Streptomyces sp. SHP22-7]RIH58484.1 hypothetical protein D3C59_34835 [Streptomyces sp. SHP22-7]
MRTWLEQASSWTVGLVLFLIGGGVPLALPFAVTAVWPGASETVLVVGNLFLGMFLGTGAMLAFMYWRLEIRR